MQGHQVLRKYLIKSVKAMVRYIIRMRKENSRRRNTKIFNNLCAMALCEKRC